MVEFTTHKNPEAERRVQYMERVLTSEFGAATTLSCRVLPCPADVRSSNGGAYQTLVDPATTATLLGAVRSMTDHHDVTVTAVTLLMTFQDEVMSDE